MSSDELNDEYQSMVRMLLYLRAEMMRNKLAESAKHLDDCINALMIEASQEQAENVVSLFDRRRF